MSGQSEAASDAMARSGSASEASRHLTAEERSVLALERIADELTLLNQSFEQFLDSGINKPGDEDRSAEGDARPADAEPAGEVSVPDSYSVGGHRYANLQHSFREARRARDDDAPPRDS